MYLCDITIFAHLFFICNIQYIIEIYIEFFAHRMYNVADKCL